MSKATKGAGRKAENGNVTVDLGEAIDKKLRAVVNEARREDTSKVKMGGTYRPGMFSGGYRPGGFRSISNRPALGGGSTFRPPWYADRESRLSGLGASWLPSDYRVNTMQLLTGAGIGLVANRALARVIPPLINSSSALTVNAISFVIGVIPALVKRNSGTIGVAIPGAVYLTGSLIDWAFDKLNIGRPALAGARPQQGGIDQALAARQRLADMRNRVNPAAAPAGQSVPRAYAQVR